MEGQKKANWADESEEDWSDQERPAPEQKSQVTTQSSRREALISQVKTHSLPLTLYLSNLSYRISERDLAKELLVSDTAEIKLEYSGDKPSGQATIRVTTIEDALKVAERQDTEVHGRTFCADISGFNSYGRGRGRGSGRRGGGGGRRGGRRNYDDSKGYERSYENRGYENKSYENRGYEGRSYENRGHESRGYGKYQEKSERQDRYHPKNTEEDKQTEKNYERRYENKSKADSSVKIQIAPSEDTSKTNPAPQPAASKPKSNPFGQARPVDTLNKDLEFEKRLETDKKVVEEEPAHEKRYKVKDAKAFEPEANEAQPKVEEPSEKVEQVEKTEEKPNVEDSEEAFQRHPGQRGKGRRGQYRRKNDSRQDNERRKEDDEHRPDEVKATESWGLENTEERGEHDKRKHFERNNYNKRGFDDRKRGSYEKKYDKKVNRNYEEKKNEEQDVNYAKQYENKKKEPVKVNAWGNPDISAEILKKPKETKPIQEEEKQTKKGTTYIKKSYRE